MINEANAELIASHPVDSVLLPACPPTAPSRALAELAYALDELAWMVWC